MKHYIKLNSETFEVKELKYETEYLDYKTLDDCYVNPDKTKRVIYNDWVEWLDELILDNPTDYEFGHLTVLSYNSNIFTLGVEVYNKLGELVGQLYIEKNKTRVLASLKLASRCNSDSLVSLIAISASNKINKYIKEMETKNYEKRKNDNKDNRNN